MISPANGFLSLRLIRSTLDRYGTKSQYGKRGQNCVAMTHSSFDNVLETSNNYSKIII